MRAPRQPERPSNTKSRPRGAVRQAGEAEGHAADVPRLRLRGRDRVLVRGASRPSRRAQRSGERSAGGARPAVSHLVNSTRAAAEAAAPRHPRGHWLRERVVDGGGRHCDERGVCVRRVTAAWPEFGHHKASVAPTRREPSADRSAASGREPVAQMLPDPSSDRPGRVGARSAPAAGMTSPEWRSSLPD